MKLHSVLKNFGVELFARFYAKMVLRTSTAKVSESARKEIESDIVSTTRKLFISAGYAPETIRRNWPEKERS